MEEAGLSWLIRVIAWPKRANGRSGASPSPSSRWARTRSRGARLIQAMSPCRPGCRGTPICPAASASSPPLIIAPIEAGPPVEGESPWGSLGGLRPAGRGSGRPALYCCGALATGCWATRAATICLDGARLSRSGVCRMRRRSSSRRHRPGRRTAGPAWCAPGASIQCRRSVGISDRAARGTWTSASSHPPSWGADCESPGTRLLGQLGGGGAVVEAHRIAAWRSAMAAVVLPG